MKTRLTLTASVTLSLLSLALGAAYSEPAHAAGPNNSGGTSGVVAIDQAKAAAGGITGGDTPGFPVTLSQPGSYRLMSNLVVPNANTTAVVISSTGVTLDLNGFSISGPVTCSTSPTVCHGAGIGDGVAINLPASNDRADVLIANGSVQGVGRSGVYAPNHDGVRVERLSVMHSGVHGVALYGGGVVVDSQLLYNGQHGIVGNNLALFKNVIRFNASTGIAADVSSVGNSNVIQWNAVNVASGGMRNLGFNWCGTALCP